MASGTRMTWDLLCQKCTKLNVSQPKLSPCRIGDNWTCAVEGVYCVNAGTPRDAMRDMLLVLAGWGAFVDAQGCEYLITVSEIQMAKESVISGVHDAHNADRSAYGLDLSHITKIVNDGFSTLEKSCKN